MSPIELDHLPPGLLDLDATELHAALGGPALIHLAGERAPALFVCVLMHGNETVGWDAIRLVLRDRIDAEGHLRLPRSISLFIGNPAAAALGRRHLPEQPDFNRVWPGSELPETPEHGLMRKVVERMTERGCFASIDLHNNTGNNPHYACLNVIDPRFLQLAALFSRTLVYFVRPRGVQSQAFAALCPAVTLECGKTGQQFGIEHARHFIVSCLELDALPQTPPSPHEIDLFHTVAQVKIPPELDFGFPPRDAALLLSPELERYNFRELDAGTPFAHLRVPGAAAFDVRDEGGQDVGSYFFDRRGDELRLRVPAMPSMLTRDERVIRQDCLCYLMERYDLDWAGGQANAAGS